MTLPDLINGTFEAVGGATLWLDVLRILRDKRVKGVVWQFRAFFFSWGLWNLYYYPHLDQWLSFVGGLVIVCANAVWVALALRYRRN